MKLILQLSIAVIAIMAFVPSFRAEAQICNGTSLAIHNYTNCTVTICIPALPPPDRCSTIPPGIVLFKTIAPNTNITGVVSAAPIFYPWAANPAAPPPWVVSRITVGPSGCCVDVYYDPATCTIVITSAPVPPACNP